MQNLGVLWQNYEPLISIRDNFDLKDTDIINKLKKLEKKQVRINLVKTFGVGIMLIFLCYSLLSLPEVSLMIKIALGWICCSVFISMVLYWKKQYNSSKLQFIENSLEFIEKTIIQLKSQKQIITHLLPALVVCMIIGINLIYFDLLKDLVIGNRIFSHLIISFLFLIILFFGIRIRKKRYDNEYKPLVNELESIKSELINN